MQFTMSRPLSNIPSGVKARILQFLNEAKNAEEIIRLVQQYLDKEGSAGNGIGKTVAQRIIESRNQLPARRFRNLDQVDAVPGVGTDKILDIMKALNKPAAVAFREAMYNSIIFSNWELEHHSTTFGNEEAFQDVIGNQSALTNFVANQVEQLSNEKFSNSKAAELANLLVRKCYVEHFAEAHYASFAFAFWFYQFDADNWFSYERVRNAIEQYLNYYPDWDSRLELYMYKGFENDGILTNAISNDGLPVVVNYEEKVVTIWTAQLND
jgi:hypothetical protein